MNIDTELWRWPQWAAISTWTLNIVVTAFLHGKPRTDNYNVLLPILSAAIGAYIMAMGGFFG